MATAKWTFVKFWSNNAFCSFGIRDRNIVFSVIVITSFLFLGQAGADEMQITAHIITHNYCFLLFTVKAVLKCNINNTLSNKFAEQY